MKLTDKEKKFLSDNGYTYDGHWLIHISGARHWTRDPIKSVKESNMLMITK